MYMDVGLNAANAGDADPHNADSSDTCQRRHMAKGSEAVRCMSVCICARAASSSAELRLYVYLRLFRVRGRR